MQHFRQYLITESYPEKKSLDGIYLFKHLSKHAHILRIKVSTILQYKTLTLSRISSSDW